MGVGEGGVLVGVGGGVPVSLLCLPVCLLGSIRVHKRLNVISVDLTLCVHRTTRGTPCSPPPTPPKKGHVSFVRAISSSRVLYISFVAVNSFLRVRCEHFF